MYWQAGQKWLTCLNMPNLCGLGAGCQAQCLECVTYIRSAPFNNCSNNSFTTTLNNKKAHVLNVDNTLCLQCLAYGALAIKRQLLKRNYTQKHKTTTVTPMHARRGLTSW